MHKLGASVIVSTAGGDLPGTIVGRTLEQLPRYDLRIDGANGPRILADIPHAQVRLADALPDPRKPIEARP